MKNTHQKNKSENVHLAVDLAALIARVIYLEQELRNAHEERAERLFRKPEAQNDD